MTTRYNMHATAHSEHNVVPLRQLTQVQPVSHLLHGMLSHLLVTPSSSWDSQCPQDHSACLKTKVGLSHDAQELLLVHLAIAITISLIDHLLKLLVCYALAQLLRHVLQVLEGDLARLVIIKPEPARSHSLDHGSGSCAS